MSMVAREDICQNQCTVLTQEEEEWLEYDFP
jgi:hypothetical protein